MMSKKTQKKMKKKMMNAVMQALEAEAKGAGASGDNATEDGKKKLAQMMAISSGAPLCSLMQSRIAAQRSSGAEAHPT
jgi:hypothetical protein